MNQSLENEKNNTQALNLALKYLSYQPRTIYEVQKFIEKKGFGEDISRNVIQIMEKNNYLNDTDYTKLFIESKIKHKAKSKFAFRYELKKKGINPSIIDSALEKYSDHSLALKSVDRKIKVWQNLDDEKFKHKIMNFLRYRGFNYEISISTLNHFKKLKKIPNGAEYES